MEKEEKKKIDQRYYAYNHLEYLGVAIGNLKKRPQVNLISLFRCCFKSG